MNPNDRSPEDLADEGEAAEAYVAELHRSLEGKGADLRERVKELRCIYTVDRVLREADDWSGALQRVVEAIPPGFQFPESTAVRLRLDDQSWTTAGFREADGALSAAVEGSGGRSGRLEVRLIEQPPDPGTREFLSEEGDLLAAIAHRVGAAWVRREQLQRLRLLDAALNATPHAVVITDREGVVDWVNPAFTRATGYPLGEAVGRTPGELVGSGTHDEAFYRDFWSTIRAGEVWRGRMVNRTKEGVLRPEEMTVTPVRDESGEIAHFVAMKVDLSEREEAAEEQRRLRSVIEAIPELVGMVDPEGRALYMNEEGRTMVGVAAREEVAGRPIFDFHPDWAAEILRTEAIPTALREGSWEGETALLGPDGEAFPTWQQILVHRSGSGEPEFLSTMIRDLRDGKRREARLRFQADLLDAVGQAVVATDLEGRVTYWNRAAEDLYGWSAEEARGRAVTDMNVPDPERALTGEIMDALRRGESWTGEARVRRKDGSAFQAQVTGSPIFDPEGRLTGVIGVSSDITERRELETRFHQSQKMEAIGRLAGGVAHDFNNLLTVIQGHVQLIREDLPPDSSMDEDLGQVLKEVGRAASLTRQLLAFSRRQVLIERTLDLAGSLREMEPMLRRLIPERIRLIFDAGDEPRLIRADPAQLQQVVLNLAVNAKDAIGERGTIAFRVEGRRLTAPEAEAIPWQALPGEYACLVVEDDGSGMPSEVQERIFEPFFTTKPEGEGTGLGLSMVFGIVKQSGGHIVVESSPGRGARFDLLLPTVEGEVAEEPDEPLVARRPQGEGRTGTILLVEDEASVRAVARRALERWGYTVIEARNGEEAVAAADHRGAEIDLVVSDIVMPEMGGSELVDRLRERIPGIRIVLMSGYSEEELAVGVRHKATAFLEKPFSPEDLARTVREALGG